MTEDSVKKRKKSVGQSPRRPGDESMLLIQLKSHKNQ